MTKKLLNLRFASPEDCYFFAADNLGLLPIVNTLLSADSEDNILEPHIKTLAEMDAKKNTSYLETLYTYLKCAMSTSNTCKKLFIHRNTLDYRMQKITELTGIDWTDGDVLFKLYLSINVLRYIDLRDKKNWVGGISAALRET